METKSKWMIGMVVSFLVVGIFSIGTAWAQGLDIDDVRDGLKHVGYSPEHLTVEHIGLDSLELSGKNLNQMPEDVLRGILKGVYKISFLLWTGKLLGRAETPLRLTCYGQHITDITIRPSSPSSIVECYNSQLYISQCTTGIPPYAVPR